MEILLPNSLDETDREDLLDDFEKHLYKIFPLPFYYVVQAPLSKFIETSFIENTIKKGTEKPFSQLFEGRFYGFSHTARIDRHNVFAFLPSGKLYLSLDKNTYEQLGLEGHKSSFAPNQRHIVVINLLDPKFLPGGKVYLQISIVPID